MGLLSADMYFKTPYVDINLCGFIKIVVGTQNFKTPYVDINLCDSFFKDVIKEISKHHMLILIEKRRAKEMNLGGISKHHMLILIKNKNYSLRLG